MVDEAMLADRRRCPDCGAELPGGSSCLRCGLPLHGPAAQELWQVSVEASRLLQRRRALIDSLRGPGAAGTDAEGAATGAAPAAVRNWLLAFGVLLIGIAAVIFVTVAWGHLGIGGRGAIMAGVTTLAAGSAWLARRRGLRATAESLAVLTAALALLDAFALRASGLFALDGVPGEAYWAGATGAIAVLAGAGSVAAPLVAARVTCAVLVQAPLLLLTVYWAERATRPEVTAGAVVGSQAVLLAVAGYLLSRSPALREMRLTLLASALPTWLVALAAACLAAYGDDPALVAGCLLTAGLAGVAALAGWLHRRETRAVVAAAAGTAVACLLAGWAPLVEYVPDQWQTTAMSVVYVAAAGATLLSPARLSPARWRPPATRACDALLAVAALAGWAAIADPGITAPEAYALPAGAAILAVGYLRQRRDGGQSSWAAYGPGVALLLLPSLIAAVTDTGPWRPVLLGLGALAAVLLGFAARLQAPLVLGGLALVADALAQLAPYLEALYEALPRWVTIAAAGLLLVALGVTYERRLRDVRRLRRSLMQLQ